MASKNKRLKRVERKEMLEIDFHEYNNIATYEQMKELFSNPFEFARMYRAANNEMKKAIPTDLTTTATCAIRSRGIVKVDYVPTITYSNPDDATIEVCVRGLRSEGIGPSVLQDLLVNVFGMYRWATVSAPSFSVKKEYYSAVVKIRFRSDASTMMSGSLKTAFEDRLIRLDRKDCERVRSINEEIAHLHKELAEIRIRVENRRDTETKRLVAFLNI